MLDALRLFATAAVLVAVAACQGPAPSTTPSPSPSPTGLGGLGGDASALVRLSGREVELSGGHCTWFETEGKLVVEIGPSAAGHYLKLTAPLAWTDQELPPGAASAEPELAVRLSGQPLAVDRSKVTGEMSLDAGSGSYEGEAVGGGPITGVFDCPTVIDG